MKIIFVSMPSLHVIRWLKSINTNNVEIYWFDVTGKKEYYFNKEVTILPFEKKRKLPYIKGEFTFSKNFPLLYNLVKKYLETQPNEVLENYIKTIKPNIIHSFEMQSCSYPILKTMNKFKNIKWIYSCWGSDLYYYQNNFIEKIKIKKVLKRINILHTDCERDFKIASKLGFKGLFTGVIPGGSGYNLSEIQKFKQPIAERKIILIKGYEHKFGRALNVIKAIQKLDIKLVNNYKIVVFGSHQIVIDYIIKNNLKIKYYSRHELNNLQILELMGASKIYIGNSISDGIPNTLIESVIMGAFPIQSNPGNVTNELIINNVTGFLINNPENINEISTSIKKALLNPILIENASKKNSIIANEKFDQNKINILINNLYKNTEI